MFHRMGLLYFFLGFTPLIFRLKTSSITQCWQNVRCMGSKKVMWILKSFKRHFPLPSCLKHDVEVRPPAPLPQSSSSAGSFPPWCLLTLTHTQPNLFNFWWFCYTTGARACRCTSRDCFQAPCDLCMTSVPYAHHVWSLTRCSMVPLFWEFHMVDLKTMSA